MDYICDAPPHTWFRLVSHGEAIEESRLMQHAVERYFREAYEEVRASYAPPSGGRFIEQNIGLKDYIQRVMPMFLTLRDNEGKALATAMLPPRDRSVSGFRPIIVGPNNTDPYHEYGEQIAALSKHLGLPLEHQRCYPYQRG
ncbi:MAG: hypothetical protein ACK5JT_22440 [Hyphomicrobiaceae bacterium]